MTLQSEQINELMTALAKAQGVMKPAIKDSTNPHFKSQYADLASVWEACREALSSNGLSVVQILDFAGEKQVLVTILGHSSGQWIKSIIALPIQRPGPQELGSCLSYTRRYSLAAMVGVFQDDDDGERAQTPYRNNLVSKTIIKPKQVEKSPLSEEQLARLDVLVGEMDDKEYLKKLCEYLNVPSVFNITSVDYDRTMKSIEKRIKSKEQENGSSEVA